MNSLLHSHLTFGLADSRDQNYLRNLSFWS